MSAPRAWLGEDSIARLVGSAYVLVIVLGIICMGRIEQYAAGAEEAIVPSIQMNAQTIRWAFVGEMTMYLLIVTLSVSLFVLLRRIDLHLAMMATVFRCGEAFVGAALSVLSIAVPLQLVADGGPTIDVTRMIGVGAAGMDVVLLFAGVGGLLFFLLLLRSDVVPTWLSVWGLVTYLSIIVVSLAGLLMPGLSEGTKMFVYGPGGVFELVFGMWLVVCGAGEREE